MITLRILLSPGRRGRIVDASGRSVPQPLPAPVIGSAEPLRIILLDPATLDPADPYGFDTGAPLRLTISGDWDPATVPVYATNALVRSAPGIYDLADPSGTRTAEALALLGVLAERLCAWELTAYGGDPATEADWAHPLSVVQFDAPLRQRADSLGGDPAEAPAVDLRGPAGADGTSATVAVGDTTTLPPGSSATVENVGTASAAVLNFGIPAPGLSGVVWSSAAVGGGTNEASADRIHDMTFRPPRADLRATIHLKPPESGTGLYVFILRNPTAYNVDVVWTGDVESLDWTTMQLTQRARLSAMIAYFGGVARLVFSQLSYEVYP